MDAKLTIKLDEEIIRKAKMYASDKKLSLSRLIENYLNALLQEKKDDVRISPFVKSMSKKIDIPADYDYREDYRTHLDRKHK